MDVQMDGPFQLGSSRPMKSKEINRKRAGPSVHRAASRPPRAQRSPTEVQLKSILQATAEFYGAWNVSSGKFNLNGGSLSVLGYSDADLPTRRAPLQSLIHPDDRAGFGAQFEALLAGNAPILDCEFRLRTSAGLYRWFEMRGKTIRIDSRGAAAEIGYAVRDIHARKEKQEEILASREQLTAILQASHDCISVVDPVDFRLIAFNKSFEDMIFRLDQVRVRPGMRAEDIAPERAEVWNAFYRQTLAEGNVSQDYEFPGQNEIHHVFAQCLLRDGRVYGICTFGHDITHRKQMETALHRSEEKFAQAFREAPLALSLTSLRDFRYIDVNDSFAESSGYTREELIGKTPLDLELWVQPEKRVEMVEQVQLSSEIRNVELLYRTKSGEIRDAVGSAALMEIEDEPCMLDVVMDVTDRKRAIEALRESEERFRIAIEAGHMHAFEWDAASDVVHRSEHSPQMLDLPNGGSRHTKQELIDRMQPEDRQQYLRVLETLTPEKPVYKAVFRLQLGDGRTAWLEESGRAIYGPDGTLRKIIGITSDVTEVRQSERALRELSGRLITSQEEERRRIARELHDHIGQEAALICVQAQRLDSGVADEEHTTRADVHDLYRRIKVLATDVSKLSHRLHSSELSFLGLMTAAECLCRDYANQYGIDVDFQAKPLPPSLDIVRSLCLYRVLQEALQNVAKHSHASHVIVELHAVGNELVLKVRDNGNGFDVEKSSSGLGLLSMRERLNFVGGRFAITSGQGSGTKLTANVTL
jgi:PAS domain S-box-containing protein